MKKLFAVVVVLCLTMITLTACGSGFDGKWDCVEAEVNTYGGALTGAYKSLEQSGAVNLLCEVEIDGNSITYSENASEWKVSNVKRSGNTITFTASDFMGVTDTVTLNLIDDGKTIMAYRYKNVYTLERADLVSKILNAIPVWVYIVLGAGLIISIVGKILSSKKKTPANGN